MKDPDIFPQAKREHPDPHEETLPIPRIVHLVVGVMLAFGVVYIGASQIETPSEWGDGRSRAELIGTQKATGANVDGAATYASACAACHQASGAGLPGVFPPLAGSEWVNGPDTTAAAIVLHGISGTLTVKGTTYNGLMPAFKAQMSDDQIAAVLTHLRSQWGNASPPVTATTVAKVREESKARAGPFEGDKELAALK